MPYKQPHARIHRRQHRFDTAFLLAAIDADAAFAEQIHGMAPFVEVADSIEPTPPSATIPSMAASADNVKPTAQDSPTTAQASATSTTKFMQPVQEEAAPPQDFNRSNPHQEAAHSNGNGHGDEGIQAGTNRVMPGNTISSINQLKGSRCTTKVVK
ncbi:unnamed protein product [Urochloa humidicola]